MSTVVRVIFRALLASSTWVQSFVTHYPTSDILEFELALCLNGDCSVLKMHVLHFEEAPNDDGSVSLV